MLLGSFIEDFDKQNDELAESSTMNPCNDSVILKSPTRLTEAISDDSRTLMQNTPAIKLPSPQHEQSQFSHRPGNARYQPSRYQKPPTP
jgi:hypothetical protein